jgi:cell division septation protein DedD
MVVGDKPPASAPQLTTNNQPPTASFIVQVAAVSSQDVADILTSSLQKKGYTVAVRHEPQDALLHVQIGPFTDRKDAEAMRARVLADGFNAIVK